MPTLRQTLSLSEQLALAVRCQTPVRLASDVRLPRRPVLRPHPVRQPRPPGPRVVRAQRCRCVPHPARPPAPRSSLGTGRLGRRSRQSAMVRHARVSAPPQRRALAALVRTLRENGRLLAALARRCETDGLHHRQPAPPSANRLTLRPISVPRWRTCPRSSYASCCSIVAAG